MCVGLKYLKSEHCTFVSLRKRAKFKLECEYFKFQMFEKFSDDKRFGNRSYDRDTVVPLYDFNLDFKVRSYTRFQTSLHKIRFDLSNNISALMLLVVRLLCNLLDGKRRA